MGNIITDSIFHILNKMANTQENSQSKEALKHTEIYTELLKLSVISTKVNIAMKAFFKLLFFFATMGALLFIVYLFHKTLNYAFTTFGKYDTMQISTESILSVITVLLPAISSLIVALLKIPQIIAKYLFSIKEDNFMKSVIKNIQGYDTSMFAMEHKIEDSIMINRKPSKKSEDENLEETPKEIAS